MIEQPKRIFVFGDSLQDNGNVKRTLGAPKAPYLDGRFSDGPVASEHLAEIYARETNQKPPEVCNFAHGGALSSGPNPKSLLKEHALSVKQQADIFKSRFHRFNEDDLVLLDGGGNNLFFAIYDESPYFNLPAMFRFGNDIANIADDLIKHGARKIVIWTVPDVTVTPTFRIMKFPKVIVSTLRAMYKHQVKRQNKKISDSVKILRRKYSHAQIELFDAYTFLNGVIENPGTFGFENTTDPCVDSFGGFDLQGNMQDHIDINHDPETHLFWDWVHPTAKGQRIIAEEIYKLLHKSDLPQ